ncbi:MAG: hypothetical protein AAGF12_42545, partial [Myxococcota bacterium]
MDAPKCWARKRWAAKYPTLHRYTRNGKHRPLLFVAALSAAAFACGGPDSSVDRAYRNLRVGAEQCREAAPS